MWWVDFDNSFDLEMRYNRALILLELLLLLLCPLWQMASAEEKAPYKIAPPMLVHLRHMESTVNQAKPETVSEHRKVAQILANDLKKLMESCSMKGEAHDALHHWLVPMMQIVSVYGEASDTEELRARLVEMRQAFKDFNTRFE